MKLYELEPAKFRGAVDYGLVEFLAWNPGWKSGSPNYPYYRARPVTENVIGECQYISKYPQRLMGGETISFRAVVGHAGRMGIKTHIGVAYLYERVDGGFILYSIHASCPVGTHTRGGGSISGPRDIHYFKITGTHTLSCGHKLCKSWETVDLDAENQNAWITLRTYYGLTPNNYHI